MSLSNQAAVVVTGTSTGIGRATALHLAAQGYRVFAGVRSLADAPPGTTPLRLELTDAESITAAAGRMAGENLAAVINNAGYNYLSPFEYAEEEQARRMMEVNLFGLVRLSQACIPHLRRYAREHPGKTAKLINISSVGGLVGIPWEVFYHASKFAVVGMTEGLRSELWSQNIRAVVVCPGGIRTEFLPKTRQGLQAAASRMPTAAPIGYSRGLERFERLIDVAGRFGSPPEAVARKIGRLIEQRNPPLRQLVGADARILFVLSRLLPQRAFGRLLRHQFAPA
jgi:NAD(P)-dependent dehydrogenase (short-subunit alcohol dehydrogenase family)